MSAPAGAINGWQCPDCGGTTMTIHIEEGTTPMFLACRAEGLEPNEADCKGQAVSMGYPSGSPPPRLLEALKGQGWEWHKARMDEALALDDEAQAYVRDGGLLLRRITQEGLDLIPAEG